MNEKRIRLYVLVPLGMVLFALLLCCVLGFNQYVQRCINEDIRSDVQSVQKMFQEELDSDAEQMIHLIGNIKENKQLQDAWRVKDRERLLQVATPIFEDLRTKYHISHFYFHSTDRFNFLRVHNPPRHGDFISRHTMDETVSKGDVSHGIELGPLGMLTLGAVLPWHINGEFAGYIELGKGIEHITRHMSRMLVIELFFVIKKEYLKRENWEKDSKESARIGDWDRFLDLVVPDLSLGMMPGKLQDYLSSSHKQDFKGNLEIAIDEMQYGCGFVPLIDAGGNNVGSLITMKDITYEKNEWQALFFYIICGSLVICGIIFTFFWIFLGRIQERVVTAQDNLKSKIEDHINAEEQLSVFRKFAETSGQGFGMADLEGNLIYVNSALCRIFGEKTPEDAIGNHVMRYCSEKDAEIFEKEILPSVFETGQHIGEMTILSLDGKKTSAIQDVFVIYNENGEPFSIANVVTDISERKQDEESLKKSHQELEHLVDERTEDIRKANEDLRKEIVERKQAKETLLKEKIFSEAAINSLPGLFYLFDEEGRFLRWNRNLEVVSEYTGEEIAKMSPLDFFTDENGKAASETIYRVLREGEGVSEIDITTKSGKKIPHLFTVIRTTIDGKIYLSGTAIDITELKQAEEDLKKAKEEAEKANMAKSDFLANMSHEIRTPMNAIMGMLQILKDTRLNSEQLDSLDVIKTSSDALLSLINDILDLSKIEVGKLDMEKIPFNLRVTIEDVVELIALRAAKKNLEIPCLIASDVPIHLKGDPGRLRQILVNLMGNAIKFTEEGEVSIRVRLKENGDEDVLLQFYVTDTGTGIPQDRIHSIFEAFLQADGSITRKYGGTGLGLAISKQLVELMDGEIGVDSIEGEGSTFEFFARFSKDDKVLQGQHVEDVHPGIQNIRILVVEKNETSQLVFTTLLESFGCRPAAVESGDEAIDALHEAAENGDPFKLVFLDKMQPAISYEQTARKIKADPLIKDTVLFMLTSFGNRGDVKPLKDMGIKGYLVKPVRKVHLENAIIKAMELEGEVEGEVPPMITKYTLEEDSFDNKQVLVVEDQLFNQKVATIFLMKRGFKVVVAENGQKAIEALSSSSFDIVLMDVQMPVMDGLTATKEIRKMEKSTGKRIPIIAMTANVMKGDRERCLDVGMDDFVAKPIIAEEFYETLERWVTPNKNQGKGSKEDEYLQDENDGENDPLPLSTDEAIDLNPALVKFGDDMSFFCELAELFINDTPGRMKALENGLKKNNADEVKEIAHELKGISGNFEIKRLYELFTELQEHGEKNRLAAAYKTFSKASAVYEQVESAVKKLLEEIPPPSAKPS